MITLIWTVCKGVRGCDVSQNYGGGVGGWGGLVLVV
jgi:hypothetical protein